MTTPDPERASSSPEGDEPTAVIGAARVPGPRGGGAAGPDDTAEFGGVTTTTMPGTAPPGFGDPEDPAGAGQRPGQLPPIDPEELAGLQDADDRPASIRRVSPLQDEPSRLVARYLFPTERYRGEWRRHLIHLVSPIATGIIATVVLGLGGGFAAAALPVAPFLFSGLAVLLWLGIMGWVAWRIADWHFDRFILTNKRVMKVSGIITRDVAMMPLLRVTDMKYEQTPLGRILNYGTFIIESAGQDQALREVPHLPNPNELYLRVVEEMYEPEAVEARMHPDEEEEEDRPRKE